MPGSRRRRAPRAALLAACLLIAGLVPVAGTAVAATTGLDVQLPLGHQIRGVITAPNGDPVADVDVSASSDTNSIDAQTAADGSFVIHAVSDGSYRVRAEDSNSLYEARYYGIPDSTNDFDQAAIVVVDAASVAGIDIRLGVIDPSAATGISGTVLGPEGQPIAGVMIQASGEVAFGTATTDADGTYRVPGLPSGDYQLFIQAPEATDFLSGPDVDGTVGTPDQDGTPITVGDTDTTGVDVVLAHGRKITGHVTTARPATIEVIAAGPGSASGTVDASGNFAIHGLNPGSYTLLFTDANVGPEQTETGNFPYGYYGPQGRVVTQDVAVSVDVTAGDAAIHAVSIPRGTDITGQVTDGRKGIAARLEVCDVTGNLGCGFANTSGDGSFRVLHVPSGNFSIGVFATDRVSGFYQPNGFTIDDFAATPVKVVSGGPDVKGIKIAVPLGASVSGTISGQNGQPLAGAFALVFPFGIDPNFVEHLTGPDGRFTQTGIPTNEYGLFVAAPEGSDYLTGYYAAGEPGHFTSDNQQATTFRVIEAGDRLAPVITFRDPAPGATGVPTDAQLSVRLSEPVDGVTQTSFVLRDAKGKIVPAAVSFTPIERTARLTPNAPLNPGSKYKLTLTSTVMDWSGNRFTGVSWSFTTAP